MTASDVREARMIMYDIARLHMSYRLLLRNLRIYLLGAGLAGCIAGGVAAGLAPSSHGKPAHHASIVWPLLLALGGVLALMYILWVPRRVGYYARPGELGRVGLLGRCTPLREPAARFHRFTMTNRPWVRFLGLGAAVEVRLIVAVSDRGRGCLTLSPILHPQADIDRFLAIAGLPVEGDWSERVGRFSIRKRWPGSEDARRQVWLAMAYMLPPVLIVFGGASAPLLLR